MELTIKDKGNIREVHFKGPHYTNGQLLAESKFEIFYSEELLRKTFDVFGSYFKDDIDRAENSYYLERPLIAFLDHYGIGLNGKKVLDFGCGSGASSVILAKLGAQKVVGIDIDEHRLSVAKLRVRDYSFTDKIELNLLSDASRLPFENDTFDVVLCQGVIEHIDYRERKEWIKEMWRVVTPGGYLLILETPNRLWPKDTHTTGLLLLPYLPPRLACIFAKAFKAVDKNHSFEDLLAMGIRGATYWEIVSAIKGNNLIEISREIPEKVENFFPLSSAKSQSFWVRSFKIGIRKVLQGFETVILHPLKIPFVAFAPYLRICLKKASYSM